MERINLAPGALTAPLPPVLVTVGKDDEANVLTIAWTGILATVPPKTYISVRKSRHSYKLLREQGEFVINLPSADMAKTVDFVGIYTGKKMDKFSKCGLTKKKSASVSAPTVAECPIALECRVCDVLEMGSHDVFIADILSVSCHENIIDKQGKMHFERANLLAYMHGEYYSLGERLGRFGFSTDKDKKDKNIKSETKEGANSAKLSNSTNSAKTANSRNGAKPANSAKLANISTNSAEKKNVGSKAEKSADKVPFYLGIAKKKSDGKKHNKSKGARGK